MREETLTYIIDTSTVLPPPFSPSPSSTITPTHIPIISLRFKYIINKSITSLSSSQSTYQEPTTNYEDEMVEFFELEFNPEEEDVANNAIMSRN